MENNKFNCGNYEFTRLWHCFGNHNHLIDIDVVTAILETSGSNVLPINTHNLNRESMAVGLELGYKNVKLSDFEKQYDTSTKIKMLNINLQQSAEDAVQKTFLAHELTQEKVIKLEVLNSDLKTSNQSELIVAAQRLLNCDLDLQVYPLFQNDYFVAKELVDMGCPLLRVMGSDIGAGKGIKDLDALERVCNLGVPVVLDGGIGSVEHVIRAVEFGIEGVLINSMMFSGDKSPVDIMAEFKAGFYELYNKQEIA